jgi:hypothetical protein
VSGSYFLYNSPNRFHWILDDRLSQTEPLEDPAHSGSAFRFERALAVIHHHAHLGYISHRFSFSILFELGPVPARPDLFRVQCALPFFGREHLVFDQCSHPAGSQISRNLMILRGMKLY